MHIPICKCGNYPHRINNEQFECPKCGTRITREWHWQGGALFTMRDEFQMNTLHGSLKLKVGDVVKYEGCRFSNNRLIRYFSFNDIDLATDYRFLDDKMVSHRNPKVVYRAKLHTETV